MVDNRSNLDTVEFLELDPRIKEDDVIQLFEKSR